MNTPIYLRDLQPELRQQIERDILTNSDKYDESVVIAVENDEDVEIGSFLTYTNYKAV